MFPITLPPTPPAYVWKHVPKPDGDFTSNPKDTLIAGDGSLNGDLNIEDKYELVSKQIRAFKFYKWNQKLELIYFKNETSGKDYSISVSDVYIANFDELRKPMLFDQSAVSDNPNIIRDKMLLEGICFLKATIDNKNDFEKNELREELIAFNNQAGEWRKNFLNLYASSKTKTAAQASLASANAIDLKLDVLSLKDQVKTMSSSSQISILRKINELNTKLSVLQKAVQARKEKSDSGLQTTDKKWFNYSESNCISFASLLVSAIGLGFLLSDRKKARIQKIKEEDDKINNRNSDQLNQLKIEVTILELQNEVKKLRNELNGYLKQEPSNTQSPGHKYVF